MKTALYRNLNEGIDIDIRNRIVSFKPNDSTPLNCFTKGEFNNITVWSIFKRFGNRTTYDGNPLIYALKGENGWKFLNKANKELFFEQVEMIIKKFLTMNKPDTIIVLPSSNPLNNKLAEMIVKNSHGSEIRNCK